MRFIRRRAVTCISELFTDGTVIWTSPTGHTYVTYPGSQHLFPKLCEPTATLWTGDPPRVDTTATAA